MWLRRTVRGVRTGAVVLSAAAVPLILQACGGSSSSSTTATHTTTSSVTAAAERAAAPFGQTSLPLFTCELTVSGKRARYAVQVLQNGCFVAERLGGGQSVQGCGVKRS